MTNMTYASNLDAEESMSWERATYTLNKLMDVNKMIPLLCNSSSTRQRTLLGFQCASAFEKASRKQAFLMHTDFEILVKSDVECLNGLLKLCNLHSSKVMAL